MVIRNYYWLNSASPVLISTCSTPLVQTGECKQFSLFDLDICPTTLTYSHRLAKVKVDLHAKNHCQRSNGSNRRAPTDKRMDTHTHTHIHTDTTKRIISPATQSIIISEFTLLKRAIFAANRSQFDRWRRSSFVTLAFQK